MINFREKKGITLIALVITIIVLLILAGVALSLVMGENGITERAVNAGKIQNMAGAKEKLELDVANYASEFYQAKYVNNDSSATSLQDYVIEKLNPADYAPDYQLTKDTVEKKVTLTSNTNSDNTTTDTATINENGKVIWRGTNTSTSGGNGGSGGSTPTANPMAGFGPVNSAYIADFGKLTDYSATQGSNWRLFYADNNYAYLISDSTNDQRLDSLSGFGGDMTSAEFELGRNLNPKYTGTGNWALKTDETNVNGNIKGVAGLLDTSKWTNCANDSKGAQWAIGAPTLEMFIASYNATHETQLDSIVESATSTGYKVNKDGGSYSTSVDGLGNTSTLDNAIYCNGSYHWWLASTSAVNYDSVMYVNTTGKLLVDNYFVRNNVRPLVCVSLSNIGNGITVTNNY